jgi:hypothetical protein
MSNSSTPANANLNPFMTFLISTIVMARYKISIPHRTAHCHKKAHLCSSYAIDTEQARPDKRALRLSKKKYFTYQNSKFDIAESIDYFVVIVNRR